MSEDPIINIPRRKLEDKIVSIAKGCASCSKIDLGDGLNGICNQCSVLIKAANRYFYANIPVSYWDLSMEKDFVGYAPLKAKYDELAGNLGKMFAEGKSLLVSGLHGTGKTMMACCLLKKAVLKGYECIYTTLSDAVSAMTGAGYEDQFRVKKRLQECHILVLDEFDNRFFSSGASSDLFARSLENIIRTRLSNNLPTIVISNSPNIIETINGTLKESLGSLFNLLECVAVLGEDNRKTIK
jgi:DNA replication protein DnaC